MYEHADWCGLSRQYFFLKGEYRSSDVVRQQVVAWCVEHFGPEHFEEWLQASDIEIQFYDQSKALEFKLRWC
jgi:hypothetical protein